MSQSRSRWSHAAARLEDIRLSPSPAVAHAPDQPDSSASVERLHQLVLRSLDDDQAIDVVSIPLSGKTSIADHMIKIGRASCRERVCKYVWILVVGVSLKKKDIK